MKIKTKFNLSINYIIYDQNYKENKVHIKKYKARYVNILQVYFVIEWIDKYDI